MLVRVSDHHICSPHRGAELLGDGTGVWVGRDAGHNRASLLGPARFAVYRQPQPSSGYKRCPSLVRQTSWFCFSRPFPPPAAPNPPQGVNLF